MLKNGVRGQSSEGHVARMLDCVCSGTGLEWDGLFSLDSSPYFGFFFIRLLGGIGQMENAGAISFFPNAGGGRGGKTGSFPKIKTNVFQHIGYDSQTPNFRWVAPKKRRGWTRKVMRVILCFRAVVARCGGRGAIGLCVSLLTLGHFRVRGTPVRKRRQID